MNLLRPSYYFISFTLPNLTHCLFFLALSWNKISLYFFYKLSTKLHVLEIGEARALTDTALLVVFIFKGHAKKKKNELKVRSATGGSNILATPPHCTLIVLKSNTRCTLALFSYSVDIQQTVRRNFSRNKSHTGQPWIATLWPRVTLSSETKEYAHCTSVDGYSPTPMNVLGITPNCS